MNKIIQFIIPFLIELEQFAFSCDEINLEKTNQTPKYYFTYFLFIIKTIITF